MKTGFRPQFNIEHAIDELINYFMIRRKNDFRKNSEIPPNNGE